MNIEGQALDFISVHKTDVTWEVSIDPTFA